MSIHNGIILGDRLARLFKYTLQQFSIDLEKWKTHATFARVYHVGTLYKQLVMVPVLAISSRKFREHQREFLELVDKGTRLIVKRGEDKAYVITPISMEELYFTPEMEKRIVLALQSIKDGKGEVMTSEQIEKMLGV